MKDFKKINIKTRNLKEMNQTLVKEKEEAICEHNKLKKKNKILKDELDKLKPLVDKFTCSSKKLQIILNN